MLIAADTIQPPVSKSPARPVAHRLPLPNGSSKIGAMFSRYGTSSMP
jgi:hypothetical protein